MVSRADGIPKVLFLSTGFPSFCRNDHEALKERYVLRRLEYKVGGIGGVARFSLEFLREMGKCDYVFSWFGDVHSAIASIFGRLMSKKVVIVAGGYDVANEPLIGYGMFRSSLLSLIPRTAFGLSHGIVAVSKCSRRELLSKMPWLNDRIVVIYNGVDTETFKPGNKRPLAINVGIINSKTLEKKGIRSFILAASNVPEAEFVHVGKYDEDLLRREGLWEGKNVRFLGFVDDDELAHIYSEALVCVQASYHESFGMTVAEAMASGCVPVVTKRGALPEVAGDCGIYVDYGDPQAIAVAVRETVNSGGDATIYRRRAVTMFDIRNRNQRLLQFLGQVYEV